MKKRIKEIFELDIPVGIVIVILTPILALAINIISEGYRVSQAVVIIDAHNLCRSAAAVDGKDYFTPTKTSSEWQSFINNKPSGVALNSCVDIECGCASNGAQTCVTNTPGTIWASFNDSTISSCNASNQYTTYTWPNTPPQFFYMGIMDVVGDVSAGNKQEAKGNVVNYLAATS